jgi:hypothetical protein
MPAAERTLGGEVRLSIMQSSNIKQAKKAKPAPQASLAKPLAPEDVRTGDFVAVLHVVYELPSFLWFPDAALLPPEEPVRVTFLPGDSGVPLKVRAVCLPFLLVEDALGEHRVLDLRRTNVARLDRGFAKTTWKAIKKAAGSMSSLLAAMR